MIFGKKDHVTPCLTAEELDVVVQKLGKMRSAWLDINLSPVFEIKADRYWADDGSAVMYYRIHLPNDIWESLRKRVTDEDVMDALLSTDEDE